MTMLGTQDWIDRDDLFWWSTWLVLVGSGLLTVSLTYVALDLPSVGNRQRGQSAFVQLCFLPLVVATAAFTLYWAWSRALNAEPVSLSTAVDDRRERTRRHLVRRRLHRARAGSGR